MTRRPGIAVAALAAALALGAAAPAASATVGSSTARAASTIGGSGVGDRLFPFLGNTGYDVTSYDLYLRYAKKVPTQTVTGDVRIRARATKALTRFDLDYAGPGITSVEVNGRGARWARKGEELVITPRYRLGAGYAFTVVVRGFRVTPTKPDPETAPAGFFASKTGTVLAFQPDFAHRFLPSSDHPSDKARYRFFVDVPAGWTAVANGLLDGRRAHRGRVEWRYTEPEQLATELLQVAVGDYTVIGRGRPGGVVVRDVVPRRLVATVAPKLAVEVDQLAWMQAQVGRYPFRSYGGVVADQAIGYSLETQTLTMYDSPLFARGTPVGLRNGTMLHELSHEWFGDSVSPYRWSDLWLNEGHATFWEITYDAPRGYLEDDFGSADELSLYRDTYRKGDLWRDRWGPVARPRSGAVDDLYNPNVYEGGALALYALRQEIGASAFAELERRWVTAYAQRSASTDDFVRLASAVAGRDLRTFLLAWLYGTRTPPMPGHPDWTVDPVPASSTPAQRAAALAGDAVTQRSIELVRRLR
jgi:aminopeptidase N